VNMNVVTERECECERTNECINVARPSRHVSLSCTPRRTSLDAIYGFERTPKRRSPGLGSPKHSATERKLFL